MSVKRDRKKETNKYKKSAICILAGRDSEKKNEELGRLMAFILHLSKNKTTRFTGLLENYFFVFTEGTFNRIFANRDYPPEHRGHFWEYWETLKHQVSDPYLDSFFKSNCICIPRYREGGIILFANMVVAQRCSIVWPFLDPHEAHCTRPENLALLRLCDVWKAKWLPNLKSVIEWILDESELDAKRSSKITLTINVDLKEEIPSIDPNGEEITGVREGRMGILRINNIERNFPDFTKAKYPRLVLKPGPSVAEETEKTNKLVMETIRERKEGEPKDKRRNIALIAHDAMKPRMVEFVAEYKKEIDKYVGSKGRISTTYATGKEIERNVIDKQFTDKIDSCLSGPLGGDIQIATKILLGRCDCVIFFIDPLNPHAHVDDIRVVLMAGMTSPNVRVLTNEPAARAWAEALRKRYF